VTLLRRKDFDSAFAVAYDVARFTGLDYESPPLVNPGPRLLPSRG